MRAKTNYLKLNKPIPGSTQWGDALNFNMDTIDAKFNSMQAQIKEMQNLLSNNINPYQYTLASVLYITLPVIIKSNAHKQVSYFTVKYSGSEFYVNVPGNPDRTIEQFETDYGYKIITNFLTASSGVTYTFNLTWINDQLQSLKLNVPNVAIYCAQVSSAPPSSVSFPSIYDTLASYNSLRLSMPQGVISVSCGYLQQIDSSYQWIQTLDIYYLENPNHIMLDLNTNNGVFIPDALNIIAKIISSPAVYVPTSIRDGKLNFQLQNPNEVITSIDFPKLPYIGTSKSHQFVYKQGNNSWNIWDTGVFETDDILLMFYDSGGQFVIVDYKLLVVHNQYQVTLADNIPTPMTCYAYIFSKSGTTQLSSTVDEEETE